MSRLRYKVATVRWNCSAARCDQPRMCHVRLLLLCLCVLVAMTLTLAISLSNQPTIEYDFPPRPPDLFKDKVRGLQAFLFLCTFLILSLEHNSPLTYSFYLNGQFLFFMEIIYTCASLFFKSVCSLWKRVLHTFTK